MTPPDGEPISSPCVRYCVLDDADQCVGCFRTLDEITSWIDMGPAGRRAVLAELADREEAYRRRWPRSRPR